jgi:hypothetical protein
MDHLYKNIDDSDTWIYWEHREDPSSILTTHIGKTPGKDHSKR